MRFPDIALVLSLVVSAASLMPLAAEAASPFDGAWSVTQVCDATSTGARGYTWRYNATVTDGRFVGQKGTPGKPASMTLTGTIKPDGSASFIADGVSGDAEYNVKFAQAQTPIHFALVAKFEGTKGSATRTEGRVCRFTFVKDR